MNRRKKILFFFLLLSIPIFSLHAITPSGFVNDFAGVIDPEYRGKLENLLQNFQQKTGIEIVVLTFDKMPEGKDIETFATDLFQKWGIGKKETDEGLLIFAVIQERLLRIETGYGLEADLPDAYTARVAREFIHPYFKQGEFGEGFWTGVVEFIHHIAEKRNLDLSQIASLPKNSRRILSLPTKIVQVLFGILLLFLIIKNPSLLFLLFLGGGGGGRGIGGFGGGFGGFGGGLSGGGGSTTRW